MHLLVLVGRFVGGEVCFHPFTPTDGADDENGVGPGGFEVGGLNGGRIFGERRRERMVIGRILAIGEHDCFRSRIVDIQIFRRLKIVVVLLV